MLWLTKQKDPMSSREADVDSTDALVVTKRIGALYSRLIIDAGEDNTRIVTPLLGATGIGCVGVDQAAQALFRGIEVIIMISLLIAVIQLLQRGTVSTSGNPPTSHGY